MSPIRILLTLMLLAVAPLSAQNTNTLIREVQRDLSSVQTDVKALNSKFDEKLAIINTLLQQAINEAGSASKGVAVLDRQIRDSLKEQSSLIAAPVATLRGKIETLGAEYSALNENVKDLTSRTNKIQGQLTEVLNILKIMAAPPKPPEQQAQTVQPGGPPAGATPQVVYDQGMKNKDGGEFDLALANFKDYLTWWPNGELAPNAQFYIGQVLYYKKDYDGAIESFDTVIEKYPENNKTPDAMYLKGRALLASDQKNKARQVLAEAAKLYPNTEPGAPVEGSAEKPVGAGHPTDEESQEVRAAVLLGFVLSLAVAQQPPQQSPKQPSLQANRTLYAFPGKTPSLDGAIAKGEWDDATQFFGVADWVPQFSPTTDPADLSVHAYVKHDGKRLYFAFDVTDDVLYGIDTPRWLPEENPKAHELTREGFPWFGDEMEILLNPTNKWKAEESVAGNGQSWQMVCNLTKSRPGGVGHGGLLEGEPRRDINAWNTYRKWIDSQVMECAAKPKTQGKGYIIEWAINFNPCIEIEPGRFYGTGMGNKPVGLNIALGDLDEKEKGEGNFGHFHHEDWFSGAKNVRTQLRHFGTLWMMSDLYTPPPQTVKPKAAPKKSSKKKTKTSRKK